MADLENSKTDAFERPADLLEQLRAAGVDRELISKTFEIIETERAKAIAKAARLFYDDAQEAMTPVMFGDELHAMKRRVYGLVAAVGELLEERDDVLGDGVRQLVNDVAKHMERLSDAFNAERWLAREQE